MMTLCFTFEILCGKVIKAFRLLSNNFQCQYKKRKFEYFYPLKFSENHTTQPHLKPDFTVEYQLTKQLCDIKIKVFLIFLKIYIAECNDTH